MKLLGETIGETDQLLQQLGMQGDTGPGLLASQDNAGRYLVTLLA